MEDLRKKFTPETHEYCGLKWWWSSDIDDHIIVEDSMGGKNCRVVLDGGHVIMERDSTRVTGKLIPIPKPMMSVTLANGDVVEWPEPLKEMPNYCEEYWFVGSVGVTRYTNVNHPNDLARFERGIFATKSDAQQADDALRKIMTQGRGE